MTEANGKPIDPQQAHDAAAKINAYWQSRGWNGRKRNIYVCVKCCGFIVTEDADHGVTPTAMACRAKAGCDGAMESSMYRVWDQRMTPTHQWRRPTEAEQLLLIDGERDWVATGGLLIRALTPDGNEIERKLAARLKIVRTANG